jgi:hypothetical protein
MKSVDNELPPVTLMIYNFAPKDLSNYCMECQQTNGVGNCSIEKLTIMRLEREREREREREGLPRQINKKRTFSLHGLNARSNRAYNLVCLVFKRFKRRRRKKRRKYTS